jgi:hypothetical protein
MIEERELQMRIPCWVIAETEDVALKRGPRVSIMQTGGKSIVQVFLEQDEAFSFIEQAKLENKVPFLIPSIQHLVHLMEHLQKGGVNEVHVCYQAPTGVNRANVNMNQFVTAIKKHVPPAAPQ